MKLGYLAIDQYGQRYKLDNHPRKELLEYFGRQHADKIYVDRPDGATRHVGYVIGGHWLSVYEVHDWDHQWTVLSRDFGNCRIWASRL